MKIVKLEVGNRIQWGELNKEETLIYTNAELTTGLNDFEEVIEIFSKDKTVLNEEIALSGAKLLAPVIPTKNILCVGKNYYDHVLEFDGNADDVERVKEIPVFFTKALSSITGHNAPVYLHEDVCRDIDYEAELAVVIGKKGINISKDKALDYVYGYTIINDVTSREMQSKHQQWFKGKSLDSHCPIGPWIVTTDEIKDGNNLDICLTVNGEIRQDANTKLMMHDIESIIAELSKGMTLNPGDVIATGTPKGVGKGFNPPRYLKAGDKMEVVVEGIGTLTNYLVSSIK